LTSPTATLPPPPTRARRLAGVAVAALVLVAVLLGPLRTLTRPGFRFNDFAVCWTASRTLLTGGNPYDPAALAGLWHDQGIPQYVPDLSLYHSIVTPATLVALWPLAALPAKVAWWTWIALTLTLWGLAAVAAARAARLGPTDRRTGLFLSAAFLFGPFVSGAGNPGVPAGCLMVLAVAAATRRRDGLAGVCLGLACALKVQLAVPLLAYYAFRRRWRLAGVAAAVLACVVTVAAVQLAAHPSPWRQDWANNLAESRRPGGQNDYTPANPNRDHIVNVESIVASITGSRAVAAPAGLAIAATLGITLLVLVRKGHPDDLLADATAAALCALPVYHRYYDTIPLLLAVAWAIGPRGKSAGPWRWFVLVPLACYLVPVGWQTNLLRRGIVPQSIETTPFWQVLVMPLPAWVLLTVVVALLGAVARVNRTRTTPAP
jgi:hypothetical protein